TQALRSDVQLFECDIATRLPVGVVTKSISGCTFANSFSKTTIAKTDVPAETFPVRSATLFVATIPVPASPSGGHKGIPASNWPVGSSNFAPASVSDPASSPATRTLANTSSNFQGN